MRSESPSRPQCWSPIAVAHLPSPEGGREHFLDATDRDHPNDRSWPRVSDDVGELSIQRGLVAEKDGTNPGRVDEGDLGVTTAEGKRSSAGLSGSAGPVVVKRMRWLCQSAAHSATVIAAPIKVEKTIQTR